MTSLHKRVAVDCYVRASARIGPVDDAIDRLREYHEQGRIHALAVEPWPSRVHLTDDPMADPFRDRYDRFRAWAEDHDVALEPAFELRSEPTLVSEGTHTVLVLPVICLAVHVGGELRTVVPHTSTATTYTVGDALEDLGIPGGSLEPSVAPVHARETPTDLIAEQR